MFFVFSKEKIVSYLISFSMVMILLGIAFYFRDNANVKSVNSNNIQYDNVDLQNKNK